MPHVFGRGRPTIVALLLCSALGGAEAQVPPHMPGTVCFTPSFWCWALQPGPPGGACACPTPYGWVPGFLG